MVGNIFNTGREAWEVRIGRDEVHSFFRLVESLPPRHESDLFFYECRPDGTRVWHHVDQIAAVTHRTTGSPTDEVRILSFTEHSLHSLACLLGWEDECIVHTGEDGVALVARTLEKAFMWEVPAIESSVERHLVPLDEAGWNKVAVIEGNVFRSVSYHSWLRPRRAPNQNPQLYPYTTFAFSDGELRVVQDHRRVGGLRTALAVPASTTTEKEFNFPAAMLEHFHGGIDTDCDVEVHEHDEYSFVRFTFGPTAVHVRLWHEDSVRWWGTVTAALERLDCEIDESERGSGRSIPFTYGDEYGDGLDLFEGVATIITRDSDQDDRVRLSTQLVDEVPDSPAALREVLEIASTLCDVALSLDGRALWATVDVPLSSNVNLGPALVALLRATAETSDLRLLLDAVA